MNKIEVRESLFENRTEKDSLYIEAAINTDSNFQSSIDDVNAKFLELMQDSHFRDICLEGNKKDFIVYLIQNDIIQLQNNSPKSNIRMGWFKSNSNVYTDINAVVAGGAIAVTLVAAAAEAVVAAAVYLLLKESDEVKLRPLDMLRNETFKSCVRIANKLGGVDFSNEILDVFTSLENGEKVVL